MKPGCSVVVSHFLPAIRVMVAEKLISEHNLKPVQVARKMEVTPAAITHYMKGVRGRSIIESMTRSRKIQKAVTELANELAKDDVDMTSIMSKLCQACKAIRSDGLLCSLHAELVPSLQGKGCRICKGVRQK